jgi:hypothetical protein
VSRAGRDAIATLRETVSEKLSMTSPLGDAIETFVRREDAERFIEEVRSDDPYLASYLRIEERELDASGRN